MIRKHFHAKYVFVAILIFSLAFASWYFLKDKQACSSIIATTTVLVQEGVFDPSHLSIRQCTEVTFKNVGVEMHWPASDLHPTHGLYPEFDPQRPVDPGESWTFIFDKVGTWKCHDHLTPHTRCIIEVYISRSS